MGCPELVPSQIAPRGAPGDPLAHEPRLGVDPKPLPGHRAGRVDAVRPENAWDTLQRTCGRESGQEIEILGARIPERLVEEPASRQR